MKMIAKKLSWVAVLVVLALNIMSLAQAAGKKEPSAAPELAAGTAWVEPKTGMEFAWVPSGCFQMGGDSSSSEQPIHKVCIKGFWMARYEVTQAQYEQVMGNNPSRFRGIKNPVENVSWDDALNFTQKMGNTTGTQIKLPSEAEWEYACRAGRVQGRYCGEGDDANHLAWNKENSLRQAHPVGKLAANGWGLYDMSGSVWEWVQDCWHDDYKGAPADGAAWQSGQCRKRVLRGGSWCNDPSYIRAGFRYGNDPEGGECGGFRVARMLNQ